MGIGWSVAARRLHCAWLSLRNPGIALTTFGCASTHRHAAEASASVVAPKRCFSNATLGLSALRYSDLN